MLDTRPKGIVCCVSYRKMESSDATANTMRYGNWNALGRTCADPSVGRRDGPKTVKTTRKGGLHRHARPLTNGVRVLAFVRLGPQFKVDGAAAHSQRGFSWTRQVGNRPRTQLDIKLPDLRQPEPTRLRHGASQTLPLEALPGEDVCGIDDVLSKLHTPSWGYKRETNEITFIIKVKRSNTARLKRRVKSHTLSRTLRYPGRSGKSRRAWTKAAGRTTSCCHRGTSAAAWPATTKRNAALTGCKAHRGKYILCDIRLYTINWMEYWECVFVTGLPLLASGQKFDEDTGRNSSFKTT